MVKQLYWVKVLFIGLLLLFPFIFGCSSKPTSRKPVHGVSLPSAPKVTYQRLSGGKAPLSPLAADFNQDGFMDIAVVSHGESQLKIFWGGPGRTFKKGPIYGKELVGYHPGKILVVDWNRDGLKDIILACEGIFKVQYWKNTGKGFTKKAEFPVNLNAKSICCADLDGDGFRDLVLGPHEGNYVLILWGTSKPFSFKLQRIDSNPMTENVEIGDWNSDNKPDIFWVEKRFGSVVVALNQGRRTFVKKYIKKPGKPRGAVKDGPQYVKLADINDDSCVDAAVTLEVGKACLVYYGNCQGGVKHTDRVPAPSWGFSGLAAVGKGKNHPSMLALGEELKIFVARKIADKWELTKKPAGSLPRDLSFVDIDNDGFIDILFANSAGNTIGIIYGPL